MKSPLPTIFFTLIGIAAAGIPLAFFTAPAPHQAEAPLPQELSAAVQSLPAPAPAPAEKPPVHHVDVPTLVRYTDDPMEIIIRHEGSTLCTIKPKGVEGKWRGKLRLPELGEGALLELEVEGVWPDPLLSNQVITLEISPHRLPARRDTQWAETGQAKLHSIFTFKW